MVASDGILLPPATRSGVGAANGGTVAPAEAPPRQQLKWTPILFVCILAALFASFPARNSDLWIHLAAGRNIAGGQSPFGEAPSLAAEPQANHAWLYDLLSYSLYSALGEKALLLVKVLLVVGLALVLLRMSRSGSGWWVSVVCTALALLTMSIHLLLQPATVSYLFLALALWSVLGPDFTHPEPPRSPWRPPWPLLVLFAVWANVDSWFVLGLGTATLAWLGRTLDSWRTDQAGRVPPVLRISTFVLPVAVLGAVCLLNPSPLHTFALPQELGSSSTSLTGRQVTSPFDGTYLATLGQSPAALAYFPLLGLGLLSFVLTPPHRHWQRFLPWLGLALVSAFSVRAVPFFAVLAGPVLAWNLQEFLDLHAEAQWRQGPLWHAVVSTGRAVAVTLALLLLVCAWPGWLQAPPFEPRRWGVELPPSLEQGAAATRSWHREGKLGPDARGLHLSPETAYAFAWFCPEEKGLVDDGLAAAVRGTEGAPEDWAERMRSAGVDHVIVYDTDRERLFATLGRLFAKRRQWPLLYQEGDLAVFGWRDPERSGGVDPFRGLELDLDALAFQPGTRKAPRKAPTQEPEVRLWWEAFWKPAPPRLIGRDEAMLHLLHAEALRQASPDRNVPAWEASQLAGLLGTAGTWTGPNALLDACVRRVLIRPPTESAVAGVEVPTLARLTLAARQWYALDRDDTPPALLYLAVRAARRALAVNPNDAQSHLALGECYLRLLHDTRERAWGQRMPEIVQLRRAQASAALNQAVTLKPNLARAHLRLVDLYREMGYLDLELNHLRAYLKLVQETGPSRGIGAEEFRTERARLQEELSQLDAVVQQQENAHVVLSARNSVADRALMAVERGLAGKARDLLLQSDLAAFGAQGMELELKLLLWTGRAREVREWVAPEQKNDLGAFSYHWLRAQALAAGGDYALAEQECEQLAALARGSERLPPAEEAALVIGEAILSEQPLAASVADRPARAVGRTLFSNRIAGLAKGLQQEANANALRGLIALEEGDVEEADVAFRLALAVWGDEATAASGGGLDFKARPIAQGCHRWLE
jgi:hypothetical protein